MIIRLFVSLTLLAATASAFTQCLVCLDGSAPGNPQAQVAATGGLTCQYFYDAVDLPASSNQCQAVHTAENQAVCGCKTTAAPTLPQSDAPVATMISRAPLAPRAESTAPVAPPTEAIAPVVPPTEAIAPIVPLTETTSPVAPSTETPPPVAPLTETTPSVAPLTETTPPVAPSTETTPPVTLTTVSGSPVTTVTISPVMYRKSSSPVALVSTAPFEPSSVTPAPVGSGSLTNAPLAIPITAPVVVPTSQAPVSPSNTPAPVTSAPIESFPFAQPETPDNLAPVGTPAPVTAGRETSSPVTPGAPICTGLEQDPYQFYGNGSFIDCCDSVEKCLGDWNNNSRVYYRCVEKGSCPVVDPPLTPEIPPAVCTGLDQDPYQVYGNGSFIPCCNPTKQCLYPWDGDSRYYFRCVDQCTPPKPIAPTCTYKDQDPFQFFGNKTENKCCSGLVKCLDDWNDNDRYYYRCLECCDTTCAAAEVPATDSNKTGIPSDQVSSFVMKPSEYGVFVQKSSIVSARTSGAIGMTVSVFGVFVTIVFAVLLL